MQTFFIFLPITLLAYLHPGRLDHNGGYTNHINGKYHLHTGKVTSVQPLDTIIRIQILMYDELYSWGQSFSSIQRCESKIKDLLRENAGLDYSYVCAIK